MICVTTCNLVDLKKNVKEMGEEILDLIIG